VNGRFAPYAQASVHVEDRGFQFGDSVYEVWAVLDGRLADAQAHFDRLHRSLGELRIAPPMGNGALLAVMREALRRNQVRGEGLVYVQVTRGGGKRDHAFPAPETPRTLVVIAKPFDSPAREARARAGVAVITAPDERWARCDIKTTLLLPNVLGKQAAKEAGAAETWFLDRDGRVTEGASTSAWIVDRRGVLRTRPDGRDVLPGVTRGAVLRLARDAGLAVEERAFTPEEARGAREAFYTAASAFVTPVVRIDDAAIGEGKPGPVTLKLRSGYLERLRNTLL
jgi:D-alanine transaminase